MIKEPIYKRMVNWPRVGYRKLKRVEIYYFGKLIVYYSGPDHITTVRLGFNPVILSHYKEI